jgi:hypothetical protein
MSQPTPYTPTTDFSQQEAINASGRSTVNTAALDAELANIEITTDQICANLELIQRDDGRLQDLATELHTLSPEVLNLMGGFALTGLWTASTAYAINDIATNGDYTYVCTEAHTSGLTFDGQYWVQFGFSGGGDAQQAAADAQVSANEAAASALAASGSATTASGHATTATTQAGNASASAIAADASADAAAVSETNAANSASTATTAAANLPNATTAGASKFLQSNSGGTAWEYKTAAQTRSALGSTTVGDAVFIAANEAAARSAIGVSGQLQETTRFTAGGTADAITGTLSPAITGYTAGLRVTTTPGGANTVTGPTLNLNSLGTKTIKKRGTSGSKVALVAGDFNASGPFDLEYDGTDFVLLNPVAAASATSVQLQPISASVAANALTISASALSLDFRSTTLGSGAVTTVSGTPSNLVISSGSTLGTINATQSRIAVLAINNAGTIELAAVNIAGGNNLDETGVISTTAEGGAGGADSASTIYSTTARSNVAYRVIGYVESTQATAGTWATAPSTIQGAGGNALTSMQSLGYGQTWQNVTGSRSFATTYYNTTGKPIAVSVNSNSTSSNGSTTLTIGGQTIQYFDHGNTFNASVFGIVPVGASYSVTVNTASLDNWVELR